MYVRYNLDPATATAASQPAVWLVCALGRFAPPADLLGAIVEKASGQRLDAFFQQRIFGPLGMTDTSFCHLAAIVSLGGL